MALLLEQIEWEDPVIPPGPSDPAWEAQVGKALGGKCPDMFRRVGPVPWLREVFLDGQLVHLTRITQDQMALIHLVVSQESSCRYCYGTARAMLQVFGFDEKFIDGVEREAQLAESDPAQRAFLGFCRRLAKSNPRPAKQDREQLVALGFSPEAVAEIAYFVGMVCFANRVATLSAAPPSEMEKMNTPFWRLLRPLMRWRMRRARYAEFAAPPADGPFRAVIGELHGSQGAGALYKALSLAFAAPGLLPRRTRAFMFAVVARSLGCRVCEPAARQVLAEEGVSEATIDEVLANLASRELTPLEARLVPWVRDTVRYQQPSEIQRQTREIVLALGVDITLDAIGTAGLANATARIAMLAQ